MGLLDDAIPDRYEKNPMLAVLENYVLDAIGKLDPASAAKLNQMICKTFGGTDWKATLRDQFDLPKDTDDTLRHMWQQSLEQADAEQKEEPLSPEAFAREAVDEMFTGLGGD
jgi:hypothetical protein